MKLVLHQVMNDLRAVRWPLALWLVVLIADGLALGLKVDRFVVDADSADLLYKIHMVVDGAEMAFGWIIAARIIQADPIDTTTAFWLTRPLSAGTLLVSKLVLIGTLFLIVPNAVATGVAAANGVGGPTLLHFAAERMALDAARLLPITVAAAVTRSLPQFALTLVAAALLAAVAAVASVLPFSWLIDVGPRRAGLAAISGRLVAVGSAILFSLCLVAHQYLTRRTRRTVIAGAAAILLFFGIWNLWPWSFWAPTRFQLGPIDASAFEVAPVRLEFDLASLRRTDPSRGEIGVRSAYQVRGIPVGWVAHIQSGHSELRFATAPAVLVPGGNVSMPYLHWELSGALDSDVVSAYEHALGARIVNAPRERGNADAWLLRAAEATFQQFWGVPAEYTATLTLLARRVHAGPPVPLRAGASGALGNSQITVVAIDREAIHVREARPSLFFPWNEPDIRLALRNRGRGEAILLARHRRLWAGPGLMSTSVLLARSEAAPVNGDGAETILDPQWMANAELVLLALEPVGTFEKTVRISGFVLPTR
jgi:hypothetical protein